jgi:hypothetical protein
VTAFAGGGTPQELPRMTSTTDSPLPALLAELAADREALRAAVERVPPALRDRRPGPERWSVAEVIEHLAIVEGRIAALLTQLISGAPMMSGGDAPTGPVTLDRAVLRDRSQRITAPEPIRPTGQPDAQTAWASLEQSRSALLTTLGGAEGRDLAAVQRTHPRLGALNAYEWIASVGGHEERHTAQIHEIADALRQM